MSFDINDLKRRMNAALDTLKKEFSGLRTGRASASLLDAVTVEAYGSRMPLNQVGAVSVPEPRLITVSVWDGGMTKAVEKAIRDAGLGLNPQPDGNLIRVPVPQLNEERRKELQKIAGKYAESARVAIRNVRREGMDTLKKLEKDKVISEDDAKRKHDDVQKATDDIIGQVDKLLADKEKDIMVV
ncbi:MAG: ribosome recycling factor [Alphaproteobacteria bacterium]|nr:ribosome recycling factor [Alphaproteobacteria bacterium]